jgi:ABC-type uncharacterized transport system auxiliary subunit
MLVVLLEWGCALHSGDAIVYHAFNYPSPERDSRPTISDTLMVYRFLIADTVDMRSLVVSQSDGKNQSLMLHRWQENPADMVTELVLRDLANSGLFEKTVDQLSSARYRYALEGTIHSLQGLVKDGKASALVEAEVTLTDFEAPTGVNKNLMKRRYRVQRPSADPSPAAIVRALNLAVKELSERIRADVRGSVENPARASLHDESGHRTQPKLPFLLTKMADYPTGRMR